VTLIVTFCNIIVTIEYKYIYVNSQQKRDNVSYLPPQQSIQDEEEEHSREIGHQVFERTNPARHKQLGQFQYDPIAEGEKNRVDIRLLKSAAKGMIK